MARVDMERIGGLYWVRKTNGRLTYTDRRRLLGKLARESLTTIMRMLPRPTPTIDDAEFDPPDSRVAREAEQTLDSLGPDYDAIVGHSYRAWMFGLALAHLDDSKSQLDPESFYCAALLHDYGLISSTTGQDFTRAGSDQAITCATAAGRSNGWAETVADAICVHATPGVSIDHDGALGYYVQWGSIVDIRGIRRWQIAPHNLATILRLHPRGDGFEQTLNLMVRSEADAVPSGRFAWLVQWHLMG